MTTPAIVSSLPFGERTELLPKSMRYALSLEFSAAATGLYLIVDPSVKAGAASDNSALRHLFEEKIVTMPEGIRCDIPVCTVLSGNGHIGTASDPRSSKFLVEINTELDEINTELGKRTPMNLTCRGVVLFRGGPEALLLPLATEINGSCFVATNYETVSATYRWLTRRELFGVGTVRGTRSLDDVDPKRLTVEEKERRLSERPWQLQFSFDLYAAF